jgi:hypothetical protein
LMMARRKVMAATRQGVFAAGNYIGELIGAVARADAD